MTFQEAITQVKNGKVVKRTSWDNKTIKQEKDENNDANITLTKTASISAPYIPDRYDMYAEDWIIV